MKTIIILIAIVAAIFGIAAFAMSEKENTKEKVKEAANAAAGGALYAGSCLLELLILGAMAFAGLWLLAKIFGG